LFFTAEGGASAKILEDTNLFSKISLHINSRKSRINNGHGVRTHWPGIILFIKEQRSEVTIQDNTIYNYHDYYDYFYHIDSIINPGKKSANQGGQGKHEEP
jgi:hypothetical protein